MSYEQKGQEGRRVNSTPDDLLEGLKFFNNRLCPFGHRAWWSIVEKGLDVDYIHIDLGDSKPKWYVDDVNKYGTVPCLYDNGKPVFESLNVAEYVEEKYPTQGTSLLPKDPWEKALIREFISKLELGSFYNFLSCTDLKEQEALKEKVAQDLEKMNSFYVRASGGKGPYFLGDRFSLADIAIMTFIDRFDKVFKHYREYDIFGENPNLSALRAAFEAVSKRPAFAQTRQDAELYKNGYTKYAKQTNAELRAAQ